MDKIVRFFLLKLGQKPYFFYTCLAAISSFANIDGNVTFLLNDLDTNFFSKWCGYTLRGLEGVFLIHPNNKLYKSLP